MSKILRVAFVGFLMFSVSSVATRARAATDVDGCVSAIADDVLALLRNRARCIKKCEDATSRGRLPEDTICQEPSTDTATQTCLLRAQERIAARSLARRRCSREEIQAQFGGSYSACGWNDDVDSLLACFAGQVDDDLYYLLQSVYRPDRPTICGDGKVEGYESCDPNAVPEGCSVGQTCHPSYCYCVYPGCRNGILEPGEDCDPYAYPAGCSYTKFCGFDCVCHGAYGSASRAFLQAPEDLLE